MRRISLNRKTGLAANTPLKRSAAKTTGRKRDTGPTKKVRDIVKARADGLCERCGQHPGSQVHHRLPRRAGGTSREWINDVSNLLLLHPACHELVEHNRLKAIADGLLIPDGFYPPDVPVRLWHGTYYLMDDGSLKPKNKEAS
jgi:hypothetical protein